ncbi:18144_t:CDS:2, partial [Entrophospora sp. SA101]
AIGVLAGDGGSGVPSSSEDIELESMIKEEEKNSTEMNINQMMCKDNEYSNDNHQLKKSRIISTSSPTYKCMKCSINKSLKWWPENWKSLTKDSRHKISDLNNSLPQEVC